MNKFAACNLCHTIEPKPTHSLIDWKRADRKPKWPPLRRWNEFIENGVWFLAKIKRKLNYEVKLTFLFYPYLALAGCACADVQYI